jgi:hypothetical protein
LATPSSASLRFLAPLGMTAGWRRNGDKMAMGRGIGGVYAIPLGMERSVEKHPHHQTRHSVRNDSEIFVGTFLTECGAHGCICHFYRAIHSYGMKDASDLQRLAPRPHPRPLSKGEGRLAPNIVSLPRIAPPPPVIPTGARKARARVAVEPPAIFAISRQQGFGGKVGRFLAPLGMTAGRRRRGAFAGRR